MSARHLQPLGVLVEHRVDDVDERLVAVEQAVPAGQQVALQPALAQVLRQHLHHPAVRREVIIARQDLTLERRSVTSKTSPSRFDAVSSGPNSRNVSGLAAITSRSQPPSTRVASRHAVPGLGHRDRVVPEVRQGQVAQQQPAVGVRVRAHPPVVPRRAAAPAPAAACPGIEQLRRPVGPQPGLQLARCAGLVRAASIGTWCARHVPSTCSPSTTFGPVQPFGVRKTMVGHSGPGQVALVPRPPLDRLDLPDDGVHGRGELLVHQRGVIALDHVHRVPVSAQQRLQLLRRDPGEHGRVRDLVPVQVQDRQHRAVTRRVEELVGMPAGGQRPGLGLAVADHARHDQVRVVERRPVGVRERVPELAALVNRPGRLRRDMRRNAARK